jgi:hypothetical protein
MSESTKQMPIKFGVIEAYIKNFQGNLVLVRIHPGGGWEFFSSPPRPEQLWSPASPLSNGYQKLFPWA